MFVLSLWLSIGNSADGFQTSSHLMANMTYSLPSSAKLTKALRKEANKALWAAEKADRKAVLALLKAKTHTPKELRLEVEKLRGCSIATVLVSVSTPPSTPPSSKKKSKATKPKATKPKAVTDTFAEFLDDLFAEIDPPSETKRGRELKSKTSQSKKSSNQRLEARAQRQSMTQAADRAAKAERVNTKIVEDIKGHRTEVETVPQTRKALAVEDSWNDAIGAAMLKGLEGDDAYRHATIIYDEVSLDDCL